MMYLRIKLLLTVFCIIPSLNAGFISRFLNKKLVEPIQLQKIRKRGGSVNFSSKPLTVDEVVHLYKKNLEFTSMLDSHSNSLKILHHLEDLSSEELFSHMHKLASTFNIQPPRTEVREIALAFTFFLESRESGELLQQNLVKAIIDLFETRKLLLQSMRDLFATNKSILDLSKPGESRSSIDLKNNIKIPRKYWTILIANLGPKEILNRIMFFNKMNLEALKEHARVLEKQGNLFKLKKAMEEGSIKIEEEPLSVDSQTRIYKKMLQIMSIDPNSNLNILKVMQELELLDSEELFSYMNKLASSLNFQPLNTKVREVILAFTFFLELRKSEKLLSESLEGAILDVSKIEGSPEEKPFLNDLKG